MALRMGSKRLFDWLKKQTAGEIVTRQQVMDVTQWSAVSLRTYINKNKIAPFIARLAGDKLKVLLDGSDITERFFDETFTQTAPRSVDLSADDVLTGEHGTYRLTEPIGNGAVGRVWSAIAKVDSTNVAAKVMLPREDLLQSSKLPNVRERFLREARNGSTLCHSNVVRYLDHGHCENNPFVIMELADRSVANTIGRSRTIPEVEAAKIVRSCVLGLRFLHSQNCVHRDIKPANILEFSGVFKLEILAS